MLREVKKIIYGAKKNHKRYIWQYIDKCLELLWLIQKYF